MSTEEERKYWREYYREHYAKNRDGSVTRKYSEEQIAYAELLLTHEFSCETVAYLARMHVSTVYAISSGRYKYGHRESEEE